MASVDTRTASRSGTATPGYAVQPRWDMVQQARTVLHIGFVVLPIIAGLDKFFHLLVNWDQYLAPWIANALPFSPHYFMMGVGVVEIVAGLIVAFWPQV